MALVHYLSANSLSIIVNLSWRVLLNSTLSAKGNKQYCDSDLSYQLLEAGCWFLHFIFFFLFLWEC